MKLSEALSKVQAVIKGAVKDSQNPFFKSTYADLTSVWEACRKPLTDNGFAVIQLSDTLPDKDDYVVIETVLAHSSGEWIKGRLAMKPVKNDPQSIGSCITYARRYALSAMVGIAPEDDDGNQASAKESEKKESTKTRQQPQDKGNGGPGTGKTDGGNNKATNQGAPSGQAPGSGSTQQFITEQIKKAIEAIAAKNKFSLDMVKEFFLFNNVIGKDGTGAPVLEKLTLAAGQKVLTQTPLFIEKFSEWAKAKEAGKH
jgi:hypothetical protein